MRQLAGRGPAMIRQCRCARHVKAFVERYAQARLGRPSSAAGMAWVASTDLSISSSKTPRSSPSKPGSRRMRSVTVGWFDDPEDKVKRGSWTSLRNLLDIRNRLIQSGVRPFPRYWLGVCALEAQRA